MKKLLFVLLAISLVAFLVSMAVADEGKSKETTMQGWVTETHFVTHEA